MWTNMRGALSCLTKSQVRCSIDGKISRVRICYAMKTRLPQVDVSWGGWMYISRNVYWTFLVAIWVWMWPLRRQSTNMSCLCVQRASHNLVGQLIAFFFGKKNIQFNSTFFSQILIPMLLSYREWTLIFGKQSFEVFILILQDWILCRTWSNFVSHRKLQWHFFLFRKIPLMCLELKICPWFEHPKM